jgi:hypothetical protein
VEPLGMGELKKAGTVGYPPLPERSA